MSRHASAAGTRLSPPMPESSSNHSLLRVAMVFLIPVVCQVQTAELWHVPAPGWCSPQIFGQACSQVDTCTPASLNQSFTSLPGKGYIPALLTSSALTRCIQSGMISLLLSSLLVLALRDGPGLKEDLQILLKFWSMMLSDKKYIKTQIVGGKSTFFYTINPLPPSDSCASHVWIDTLLIVTTITIAANPITECPTVAHLIRIKIKSVPQ